MNDAKRLWNLSELEAFGLNRATIRKRLKAAGIEPVATGPKNAPLYDLVQVAPWICQRPQKQTDAPDLMGFKTAAELRAFMQSEREKVSLAKDTEELIARDDFEQEMATSIAGIKGFADNVITRIESTIPNASARQLEALEKLLRLDLEGVSEAMVE